MPLRALAGMMAVIAALFGAGGAYSLQYARSIPMPDRTRPPEIAGIVSEVLARPCVRRNRGTCWRPVATYTFDGEARQVAARSVYSPKSPVERGEPVTVLVEKDGEAWLAFEWERRLADRERDATGARRFPQWMGYLLLGCAGFTLLIAVGVAFAKPAD